MTNIDTANRIDLEGVIISEEGLYEIFDEKRLLNSGYTTEEIREIVREWIVKGDETE